MKELIILAGGLGTRLRTEVKDLPKSLAPVDGRPFIEYIIAYFEKAGITRFIFALGYRSEQLRQYIVRQYGHLDIAFSVEEEPLGTGGAIRLACRQAKTNDVFVTNGDTLFKISVMALWQLHREKQAACTLSLKSMKQFDRFGAVTLAGDGQITAFKEKQYYDSGLINGGCYLLNIPAFLEETTVLGEKFSFEKDYLEKQAGTGRLFGQPQDVYFIDMGIPEDYQRAKDQLSREGAGLPALKDKA